MAEDSEGVKKSRILSECHSRANLHGSNTKKGKAQVTFHGKGEYGGYKTVSFRIVSRSADGWWKGPFFLLTVSNRSCFFGKTDIQCIYETEVAVVHAQVKTWGNSQGIRIPKEVLQEASISVDDVLEIKVSKGMVMLVKQFRHKTLEERAAEYDGKLSLDGEFDWGEPSGREKW